MTVTVDNYTRILLTIIAFLLLVVGAGLWYEAPDTVPAAYGALPDTAEQMNRLIKTTEDIKQSLDETRVLLTSGKVVVQVVAPKDIKSGVVRPSSMKTVTPAVRRIK